MAKARHVRQAVVEQLSIGDVEIPVEAQKSWEALKLHIAGNAPPPPVGQLQQIYELVLGYQVFVAAAYRVVTVPAEEVKPKEEEKKYEIPLIVMP